MSLYSYQHFSADEDDYKSYADLVKCISIVEMTHMELLAETIFKLGMIPLYRGSYSTFNQFWNGSFVDYSRDIKSMLKVDIKSEIDAINNYRLHMSMINDNSIKDLISRIIMDEEKHLEMFKRELSKYM